VCYVINGIRVLLWDLPFQSGESGIGGMEVLKGKQA
jgi:hypothetical protein